MAFANDTGACGRQRVLMREYGDRSANLQFEPTSENGPSSSVTDLFTSFRSASDFIMNLDWPDEQQLAHFATRLAKVSEHLYGETSWTNNVDLCDINQ